MASWATYSQERSIPYKPGQTSSFKVSRSKIDDFVRCPRCFWLDRRLQITKPSAPPYSINKAVDELLKKEFDSYRTKKKPHPIMLDHKISAIPFAHVSLNDWRENFIGVQYLHEPTNLLIFGAVDDIWVNEANELLVVDYKATAKRGEVSLDAPWQIAYKRQLEVYQWLLRQNGFAVSNVGYFVYTNGRLDLDGFFDRVEFRTKIIAYSGNDEWVEPTIYEIKKCLEQKDMPKPSNDCEYCDYALKRTTITLKAWEAKHKKK